jgi:hypothetical protein
LVARLLWEQDVAGSNPAAPTSNIKKENEQKKSIKETEKRINVIYYKNEAMYMNCKIKIFHIFCFFMILSFSLFSFTGVSIAQEEELDERVKNCISCCNAKTQACFNINPDRRLCAVELEACVATCKSEGESPSEWSDCWSQSEP